MPVTLPRSVLAEIARRRTVHDAEIRAFLDGALCALGIDPGTARAVDLDTGVVELATDTPEEAPCASS